MVLEFDEAVSPAPKIAKLLIHSKLIQKLRFLHYGNNVDLCAVPHVIYFVIQQLVKLNTYLLLGRHFLDATGKEDLLLARQFDVDLVLKIIVNSFQLITILTFSEYLANF